MNDPIVGETAICCQLLCDGQGAVAQLCNTTVVKFVIAIVSIFPSLSSSAISKLPLSEFNLIVCCLLGSFHAANVSSVHSNSTIDTLSQSPSENPVTALNPGQKCKNASKSSQSFPKGPPTTASPKFPSLMSAYTLLARLSRVVIL